jgi:hypothetical protein
MLRLLASLFKADPPGSPEPGKRLGIDLGFIDQALIERDGYPRPQWDVIRAWIKANVAAEDVPVAWNEVGLSWLLSLKNHLGTPYSVLQSTNFWLLTARSQADGFTLLRIGEAAVLGLTNWLGPIADKRGHGKHVILDFETADHYYRYLSYLYPPGAPLKASGGVFLGKGYHHIPLPPSPGLQNTLIHELTHNRLAHLRSPRWLGEGLAVTMERRIGGNRFGRLDRELLQKHSRHWTTQTILAFWNGESFLDKDGEIVRLSYSLAETLVDILIQDFSRPKFTKFVSHARGSDGGRAAASQCLGIHLGELVSRFLGPGEWEAKESNPARPLST